MNQLTQKELEQIVSLYIDGELDAVETKKLEQYLATHPAVAREIEVLRTAKRLLSTKQKLPKNDWFWLKLSNALEEAEHRSKKIFLRARPAVSFTSVAVLFAIVIGAIYLKDAPLLHQFLVDKKNQVENVYRNNIMTGNILPLFANLNKEDVLNFALFGSISIDSSNNTSLQVQNTENKGSQIQIVRHQELPAAPVTMKYFANELGISNNQREIVDSILDSYKEKLQASVLVSEHDEVAIHAELVDLNREMVSTIALCLEPRQRMRFQKFLDVRKAPYTVVEVNAPRVEPHDLWTKIPRVSSSNNYVIISPEMVEIAEMKINVDSIREVARRQEMRYRKIITERMVNELTERQQRIAENLVAVGQNRVRIQSDNGAFQIHFEHSSQHVLAPGVEMVEMVRPRMRAPAAPRQMFNEVTVIGDSAFTFEIPADDQAVRVFKRLPKGEFRYEIVDSMMREPRMRLIFKSPSSKREFESKLRRMEEREEQLIDLDSLLQESEKQTIDQTPPKPKKPGKEIEIDIMM